MSETRAPAQTRAGRCAEHDLALWPDGTCLLCRRAAAPVAKPDSAEAALFGRRSLFVGLASIVGLVLVLVTVRAILVVNADARARAAVARQPSGPSAESAPSAAPGARAVDEARRAVRIRVYTTSWCGSCRQAKRYMQREGIHYSDRDIERSDEARDEYARLGQNVIPVFDVDGQVFAGFDPQRLEGAIASAAERRRAR